MYQAYKKDHMESMFHMVYLVPPSGLEPLFWP